MIPKPRDPRTPAQATRDRLVAARKKLAGPTLSRGQRAELADLIAELAATERKHTLNIAPPGDRPAQA